MGTRNYIGLISTVNCSATVVKKIANKINFYLKENNFKNAFATNVSISSASPTDVYTSATGGSGVNTPGGEYIFLAIA